MGGGHLGHVDLDHHLSRRSRLFPAHERHGLHGARRRAARVETADSAGVRPDHLPVRLHYGACTLSSVLRQPADAATAHSRDQFRIRRDLDRHRARAHGALHAGKARGTAVAQFGPGRGGAMRHDRRHHRTALGLYRRPRDDGSVRRDPACAFHLVHCRCADRRHPRAWRHAIFSPHRRWPHGHVSVGHSVRHPQLHFAGDPVFHACRHVDGNHRHGEAHDRHGAGVGRSLERRTAHRPDPGNVHILGRQRIEGSRCRHRRIRDEDTAAAIWLPRDRIGRRSRGGGGHGRNHSTVAGTAGARFDHDAFGRARCSSPASSRQQYWPSP